MRRHSQVHIQVGDWTANVDAGAAEHIRRLWHAGIPTRWSCQGHHVPAGTHQALTAARSAAWIAGDALMHLGNRVAALMRYTGGPYVMVDRAEDVDRARELLPPRYRVMPPFTPGDDDDAPTTRDLHVTTAEIPRTALTNLPIDLEVACTRLTGWCLLQYEHGAPLTLAGEFHPAWLVLDVAGHVIVDSRTPEEQRT